MIGLWARIGTSAALRLMASCGYEFKPKAHWAHIAYSAFVRSYMLKLVGSRAGL